MDVCVSCPLPYFLEDSGESPIFGGINFAEDCPFIIAVAPAFCDLIQHHNKWTSCFLTICWFCIVLWIFRKTSLRIFDGVVSSVLLLWNFWILKPRKSNPYFICVILSPFFWIVSDLFPARNLRTQWKYNLFRSIVFFKSFAVTMKSSAYRTRCILGTIFCSSP